MNLSLFSDGRCVVDGIEFGVSIPEDFPSFSAIYWWDIESKYVLVDSNKRVNNIEHTEENYALFVKPFLDSFNLAKQEQTAAAIRSKRDALIAETDFLLMPDYPISDEEQLAVMAYRKSLRDVPQQEGFPFIVEWPEKPTFI